MSNIKTEVVLELDGRKLISGSLEDFILDPKRGSQYFYEGDLYEVVSAIETIGDARSLMGTVLGELLRTLYPDAVQAATLAGGMKRINGGQTDISETAPGLALAGSVSLLVAACEKERLLYLRLKCTHRGGAQKSLIAHMVDAAGVQSSTLRRAG